jgi:hypothetical protein
MNTNAVSATPAAHTAAARWWKVPHMWLVLGLPLIAVVASTTTAFIAIKGADPVLDKAAYERDRLSVQILEGDARRDALIKLQPAHQARNNAASPVISEAE